MEFEEFGLWLNKAISHLDKDTRVLLLPLAAGLGAVCWPLDDCDFFEVVGVWDASEEGGLVVAGLEGVEGVSVAVEDGVEEVRVG